MLELLEFFIFSFVDVAIRLDLRLDLTKWSPLLEVNAAVWLGLYFTYA